MPLAWQLGERYRELFRAYGIGGNPQVIGLKGRIAEQAGNLREDAMYFLLLNLDHMVMRAIGGDVRDAQGRAIAPFLPPRDAAEMANAALDIVLAELASRRPQGGQSSANDVVRAIEATAVAISQKIAWWREDG